MKRHLESRDREFLGRDSNPNQIEVVRSQGPWLFDVSGRKILDFSSGWAVGTLGWGHPEIAKKIAEFNGPTYVEPRFLYRPWVELAELLISLMPSRKLKKCYRTATGSEAIELALQAAVRHTGRREFLAVEGSYHGNSVAAKSVAASEESESLPVALKGCRKIETPLDDRAAARLERHLKGRKIAAFILEPVVSALAMEVPSGGFIERAAAACRRYGTVLIFDEVVTGFGRTGRLFAAEHFGVEPDILCLGKAITGGYAPLSTAVMTEPLSRSLREEEFFYSTYGWHPLAVHAALAHLRLLVRHLNPVLRHVEETGRLIVERLRRIRFRNLKSLRGLGLALAVEFEKPEEAEAIRDKCLDEGLLLALAGDSSVALFPPLTVKPEIARRGLDILERTVSQEHRVRRRGA